VEVTGHHCHNTKLRLWLQRRRSETSTTTHSNNWSIKLKLAQANERRFSPSHVIFISLRRGKTLCFKIENPFKMAHLVSRDLLTSYTRNAIACYILLTDFCKWNLSFCDLPLVRVQTDRRTDGHTEIQSHCNEQQPPANTVRHISTIQSFVF